MNMRTPALVASLLLLGACAHAPVTGIEAAMHPEGTQQVGWQQVTTGDGDPLFVVRSAGGGDYAEMVRVATTHAAELCPDGYRVLDLEGNDQPQVDTLSPRFVLASEVRLKVHCYDKDADKP
jgi:hypothetical protein